MIEVQKEYKRIERAILVSVKTNKMTDEQVNEYLDELEQLAETAGAETIAKFVQAKERPEVATYVGKGKVEEVKLFVEENEIDIVIIDDELTPVQARNLEREINKKIIDRSGLILDIFAKHAQTKEAKLQVELAQNQYMMSRLTRAWTHLSKQFGGIGTKGPGEAQIETDRRLIKERIQFLKEKLSEIEIQRKIKTSGRDDVFKCSLVGYTNAGKSTLINLLTNADVYVENKLFATLDSTTRSFEVEKNKELLISDTVGFIRKLPHHLVASFRSTLKEVQEADVLLHVIDVSHPFFEEHIDTVQQTLKSLDCDEKAQIIIFNKVDKLEEKDKLQYALARYDNSIAISAKKGLNITTLREQLLGKINSMQTTEEITFNMINAKLYTEIYRLADVLETVYHDNNDVTIKFKANKSSYAKIQSLMKNSI